ncbi:MAG TPA: hypothetical protein VN832_03905 [Stellaceae bacterium]|nr:hypothetical protein [Stellaceae bacterium]
MDEAQARVKVPVVEVAVEAYRLVFGRLDLLLEFAWAPLLILLAAAILPELLLPAAATAADAAFGFTVADAIEVVVALLCLNAFAVHWHQTVLYGRQRAVPPRLFRGAFIRFLVYTVLMYLAFLALLTAILAVAFTGPAVQPGEALSNGALLMLLMASAASVLLWLAAARLSLLFPAAAYGAPLGLGAAWRDMRGNTWRLAACGFISCAPFVLIVAFVLSLLLSSMQLGAPLAGPPLGLLLLRGVVDTVSNFIVVGLGATILSGFYRRIVLAAVPATASEE